MISHFEKMPDISAPTGGESELAFVTRMSQVRIMLQRHLFDTADVPTIAKSMPNEQKNTPARAPEDQYSVSKDCMVHSLG